MFHKLLPAFAALLLTSVVITAQSDVRRASAINGAGTTTSPILFSDGTVSAPSISFASESTLGFSRLGLNGGAATGQVMLSGSNTPTFYMLGANSTGAGVIPIFEFVRARNIITTPNIVITGDYLGEINSAGYDGANYRGASLIVFGTEGTIAATRVPSNIEFYTATDATPSVVTGRWRINSAGHLMGITDNTYDIGASAATRPRTVYAGTSLVTPTVNATSAYQFNGNTFGTGTVGPSSPVGTTSTTLVMAGLAGSITTRTGRVEICVSGNLTDNTANDGTKAQISYGTGTAPTNGAALTGTQIGTTWQYSATTLAAGAVSGFGGCVIVTGLTPNTAYWLDLAFAAITGGTGSVTSAYMAAHDIS